MSAPHYEDAGLRLWHGDNKTILPTFPDDSFDSIVTDPPYELGFMGKGWDSSGVAYDVERWRECLRVLKPGGYVVAFGGSRTWHRVAAAIEDAGFEIRDSIAWLYGSGFPKSLDVAKAIDSRKDWSSLERLQAKVREARTALGISQSEAARRVGMIGEGETLGGGGFMWFETGMRVPTREQYPKLKAALGLDDECDEAFEAAEREVVGQHRSGITRGASGAGGGGEGREITASISDAAKAWEGWGTALKPAHEPVVVARKPRGMSGVWDSMGSQLDALEAWCRQHVNDAAKSSAPTPHASNAAKTGSAPEHAATPHEGEAANATATGAAGGSSAQTDTSASAWTVETFSNTVTSWRACWAELSEAMSTSTTSTAISRTIDLRTLSSSMSSLTQSVTAQSTPDPDSWSSLATAVDNLFAAGVLSSRSILALSAHESATGARLTDSLEGDATPSNGPAFEPIVVARKPLIGTVAANVLEHGTGALNIDASRVEFTSESDKASAKPQGRATARNGALAGKAQAWESATTSATEPSTTAGMTDSSVIPSKESAPSATGMERTEFTPSQSERGRFPSNVLLDESQAAELDEQTGVSRSRIGKPRAGASGAGWGMTHTGAEYDDEGGASRFFPTFRYEAKAPGHERPEVDGVEHATVKPLALMRWLVRLVTRPGGRLLDLYAGSGTTGEAALLEGMTVDLIELEADHLPLILARVRKPLQPSMFGDWEVSA